MCHIIIGTSRIVVKILTYGLLHVIISGSRTELQLAITYYGLDTKLRFIMYNHM
jgi:hypothetical protein